MDSFFIAHAWSRNIVMAIFAMSLVGTVLLIFAQEKYRQKDTNRLYGVALIALTQMLITLTSLSFVETVFFKYSKHQLFAASLLIIVSGIIAGWRGRHSASLKTLPDFILTAVVFFVSMNRWKWDF